MSKSYLFRDKIKNNSIIRLIGAHNGISAKLGETAGFDAVWASGFEIASSFCVPDANILSLTECLQFSTIINSAINIPVIADCDSGFGDINNVIHLVKLYENNNIAGICIEDKIFPKTNSFINERQTLLPIEEFVAKLYAAQGAKKSSDFFIIARIEALISGDGMEEAIKRAIAYTKAGADALLIHSKLDNPSEIFEFTNKFNEEIPLFIVPTTYFNIKLSDLINKNIKGIIYANHGIRATVVAMKQAFKSIIDNNTSALIENNVATLKELFQLQNMNIHNENHNNYSLKAKHLMQKLFIEEKNK